MKSNRKIKIVVLIILGIFFAFSSIISINLSLNNSEFCSDNGNLKISAVSPIHIDDTNPTMNWSVAKDAGICTGNGTYSEPYIIEDLEIDGGGSGSCILIENSTVYFRIEKCNLYNSGDYPAAGIKLNNTNNGQVTDNVCSPNYSGISLYASHNNTISGNIVDHNDYCGILLNDGDNNTISGNSIEYNYLTGIVLHVGGAENNNITGNTLISNQIGIQTWSFVRYNNITRNIISKNTLGIEFKGGPSGNNEVYLNCFTDNGVHANDGALNNKWDNGTIGNYWDDYTGSDSDNNGVGDIPYNIAGPAGSQDNFPLMICPIPTTQNGGRIPGFNLFMLIGILSVAVILIRMKLKKSSKLL
ncbi:MAG: nitrous oxide reductase family maturation protein NosD [Promethearchaeota archaeon]